MFDFIFDEERQQAMETCRSFPSHIDHLLRHHREHSNSQMGALEGFDTECGRLLRGCETR
jgi:hypothetical protein